VLLIVLYKYECGTDLKSQIEREVEKNQKREKDERDEREEMTGEFNE
jgi:hypothetical protein